MADLNPNAVTDKILQLIVANLMAYLVAHPELIDHLVEQLVTWGLDQLTVWLKSKATPRFASDASGSAS